MLKGFGILGGRADRREGGERNIHLWEGGKGTAYTADAWVREDYPP